MDQFAPTFCHEKRPLWGQMTTCQEDKKFWKLVQLTHSTFTAKDHKDIHMSLPTEKKDTYELTKKMPKMTPCIDKVFLCIATYYNPTSLKEVKGLENV